MPHRSILPTAIGAGLLLAGSLLFSGVAAAATGPNTPECSAAGAKLNAAQAVIAASNAVVADRAALTADAKAVTTAETNNVDAANLGTPVTVDKVNGRIGAIEIYLANPANPQLALARAQLASEQTLLAALNKQAADQTQLNTDLATFVKDGGQPALAAAAGHVDELKAAQAAACTAPAPSSTPTTSVATATPTTSATTSATTTTSGGSAQTSAGLVYTAPVGGVATGWAA